MSAGSLSRGRILPLLVSTRQQKSDRKGRKWAGKRILEKTEQRETKEEAEVKIMAQLNRSP